VNKNLILNELTEAGRVLELFVNDENQINAIEKASSLMASSVNNGGKIIACGNGGSMCDAMHFAEELTGKFRNERNPIPAIAISDPGFISCTANDYGYEKIFSRFIDAFGKHGDILLAISTSGNSANVISAAEAAKKNGMYVVALTGKDGGKMSGICDIEIRAPFSEYADRAQEIHIKVIHCMILLLEKLLSQK
jgi:D-sedoheptulose 7-phosphate isomerase